MSIALDIPPASKISEKTSYSANYFDTLSIKITPSNRILISKKPHKPFHRQESRDPLAYNTNCNNQKTGLDLPYLGLPESQRIEICQNLLASAVDVVSQENISNIDEEFGETSFRNDLSKQDIPPLPSPKKFTSRGRQTIKDAAGALEKAGYSPNQFWFFTGTLPGNSANACEGLARYSRIIVNRFKQYFRNKKLPLTFNVWETQQRGFVRNSHSLTPALHLHFVIVCPDCVGYDWLVDSMREQWYDILDDISKKTPYNLYEIDEKLGGGQRTRHDDCVIGHGTKTIQCTKSPAAYLSKYFSKETSKDGLSNQNNSSKNNVQFYYPSSWWSISKTLRKLIKNYTASCSVRIAPEASEQVFDDFVEFFKSISSTHREKVYHPDYPDYWYFDCFISPDIYQDAISIISSMASEYKKEKGVLDSQSVQLTFDETIVSWMHLKKNQYYLNDFVLSLPSYYRLGKSSVDFSSKAIKSLMREYYFKKVSNLNSVLPPPIDGF